MFFVGAVMDFTPGRRVTSGDRTAYVFTERGWDTDRYVFHRALKVFWNYGDQGKSLCEAGVDEWLRVLVRCPSLSSFDPAFDLSRVEETLSFELERILDLPETPWFAEPVDVIKQPVLSRAGTIDLPLLVLAEPTGEPLKHGPSPPRSVSSRVRFLTELLAMFDLLHREHLVVGALDPADFFLDGSGRWSFLGTGRIHTAEDSSVLRGDLVHWSRFCCHVLTGKPDLGLLRSEIEEDASASLVPVRENLADPEAKEYDWLIGQIERFLS